MEMLGGLVCCEVWTVEMLGGLVVLGCGQWICGVDSGDARWSGCFGVWTVDMWCGQWRC